jgi:hypothetical protein
MDDPNGHVVLTRLGRAVHVAHGPAATGRRNPAAAVGFLIGRLFHAAG